MTALDLGSKRRARNSGRTEYNTSDRVIACLLKFGGRPACDPCSNPRSKVPARLRFTERENGLAQQWPTAEHGYVYSNSPFGEELRKLWGPKYIEQARRGVELIAMTPASLDTTWCETLLMGSSAAVIIRGRETYDGCDDPAFFGTLFTYFGPRPTAFVEAFRSIAYPISSPMCRPVWRAAA